jgi:hypothetical protein
MGWDGRWRTKIAPIIKKRGKIGKFDKKEL